eukprot:CAMPEP_0172462136 /NCGR_PEP_ID=MMETSP1065-20121228/42870_1 /TAXON_ID=265537 /ORGANISM="Amphiprora paludosa, Strain CCMP125" /LENGTH=111 /DNA_ID=CAMNT_0013217711 /DNA_START=59 /DNA_END=390 /DNA_ORIENTATION=+
MSSSLNKAGITVNGADPQSDEPDCLAVPESFYDTLRSVHGVLCEDGFSISFQAAFSQLEGILLQHENHNYHDDKNMIHRRMDEPKSPINSIAAIVGGSPSNGKEAVPVEYR